MKKIRAIELFAGVGGFRLGLGLLERVIAVILVLFELIKKQIKKTKESVDGYNNVYSRWWNIYHFPNSYSMGS